MNVKKTGKLKRSKMVKISLASTLLLSGIGLTVGQTASANVWGDLPDDWEEGSQDIYDEDETTGDMYEDGGLTMPPGFEGGQEEDTSTGYEGAISMVLGNPNYYIMAGDGAVYEYFYEVNPDGYAVNERRGAMVIPASVVDTMSIAQIVSIGTGIPPSAPVDNGGPVDGDDDEVVELPTLPDEEVEEGGDWDEGIVSDDGETGADWEGEDDVDPNEVDPEDSGYQEGDGSQGGVIDEDMGEGWEDIPDNGWEDQEETPVVEPTPEPTPEAQPEEPVVEPTPEAQPEEPVVEPTPEAQPEEPVVEPAPEVQPEEPVVEATPEAQPEEPVVEPAPETQPEEPVVEPAPEVQPEEPVVETAPEVQPEEPVVEPTPEVQPEEPVVEPTPEVQPEEPVVETTPESSKEENLEDIVENPVENPNTGGNTDTNVDNSVNTPVEAPVLGGNGTVNEGGESVETPEAVKQHAAHTVLWGDTLYGIATTHGIQWQELAAFNNIQGTLIYPGQVLVIPGVYVEDADGNVVEVGRVVHVVRAGETLSGIAFEHGTTWQKLQEDNNIADANLIYEGQEVVVNGSQKSTQNSVAEGNYTIKSGDTLSSIARAYGTTWQALFSANDNIIDANIIFPGQSIVIK